MDIFYHSTHITESSAIVQNDWAITSPHASSLKSAKISVIIEKRVATSNLNGILVYPFQNTSHYPFPMEGSTTIKYIIYIN